MSKFKPTDDQKKAIETRDKNIIVSAAAGSGKTRVLVDRVVSLMIEENPYKKYDNCNLY
ncbi:MAG: UvrD-helicase domain-containing protein [Anaerococcus hydrogenalis]|nr:UvrD-helicase domain-containing protein [Anaerococcus hydrogenalis]